MKLAHLLEPVTYREPNFDEEFAEVKFQREVLNYFKTKASWLKAARTGQAVTLSGELDSLNNFDPRFNDLEDAKKDRVKKLFSGTEPIEMPIVLRDGDFMHLLAGNTRAAYARKNKHRLNVWMIDTPGLEEFF